MQQGIQSLMPQGPQQGPQQGPMPGQAPQMPMPGMMPQQGAPTPGAMTGSLKSLPLDQLKMLYQNPQPGSPPLWAVISALAEKQKEAQAMQAAMGQSAMAQNAQMQQQPPVAAQVMQAAEQQQEPVMAAYGGMMQGYAGGGAVAFEDGGETEDLADDPSLPLSERMARAQKRMALSRQQGVGRSFAERFPDPAQSTTDTGDELMRMLARTPPPTPAVSPEAQAMMQRQGPRGVAAPRSLGMGQRPPAAPAAALAAPMPGISATLSADEQRLFEARKAALEGRKTLPPELLEGRAGLEALMKENLAAQRAEAKLFGDEARAARDAAIARSQRSLLDDPQALLAIAGSIDTRRGRGIGSLAQGAAGVLGQRQAAAEAARKEYATAQQTERLLQANIRQGSMLEAQRIQALREGDYNRANQIDDAINQNAAERAKLEREVQKTAFDQTMEGRKVATMERQARAAEASVNRPPAELALMEWLRDPKNKKLYEEIQGVKQAPRTRQELMEQWSKNFMLQQRYPNFDDFAAAMNVAGASGAGAGEFKILSSRPK